MKKQNKWANADGLPRYKDMPAVKKAIKRGNLVKITSAVIVRKNLVRESRNYCTPQANDCSEDYGHAFKKKFKERPPLSSAVRPHTVQRRVGKTNGNTAKNNSVHPTGSAVDYPIVGMTNRQILWSQNYWVRLEAKGLVEATQEHNQPCFHVFVPKKYSKVKRG